MACERFIVKHGDDQSEHEHLDEVLQKLYAGAEKGISTQRYKGLGEMNADQLWENHHGSHGPQPPTGAD